MTVTQHSPQKCSVTIVASFMIRNQEIQCEVGYMPIRLFKILSRVLVTCRRGLDRRIDLLEIHKSQATTLNVDTLKIAVTINTEQSLQRLLAW
jgi:hypothetical protein